eukprot:Sdes_comp20103_c0_seq1m13103
MSSFVKKYWKGAALCSLLGFGISYTVNDYNRNYLRRIYQREAASYGDSFLKSPLEQSRHLTVIYNPYAGKKKSKRVFREEVEPLLHLAGITFSVVETEKPLQAKEMGSVLDPKATSGVLLIGGNGLAQEFVSGLMKQKDQALIRKLPLAFIPTGSNNGIFHSLLRFFQGNQENPSAETDIVKNAGMVTLGAIKGEVINVDVISIQELKSMKTVYSLCGCSLGTPAVWDEIADNYRWARSWRYSLASLLAIIRTSPHHSVDILLPPLITATSEPLKDPPVKNKEFLAWFRSSKKQEIIPVEPKDSERTPIKDSTENWIRTPIQFSGLYLMNSSSYGANFPIYPDQTHDSGRLKVLSFGPCNSFVSFQIFQDMRSGHYLSESKLGPIQELDIQECIIKGIDQSFKFSIDGEIFEPFEIHVKILPKYLTLFSLAQ